MPVEKTTFTICYDTQPDEAVDAIGKAIKPFGVMIKDLGDGIYWSLDHSASCRIERLMWYLWVGLAFFVATFLFTFVGELQLDGPVPLKVFDSLCIGLAWAAWWPICLAVYIFLFLTSRL